MIDTVYFRQAELLLRVLPLVDREAVFALKGGTAINFFARDLPRLSVDIDLVYIPVGERDLSLREISDGLVRICRSVESRIPGAKIVPKGDAAMGPDRPGRGSEPARRPMEALEYRSNGSGKAPASPS